MKVLGCHHTGMTVRNLERSVAWYCDTFGFKARPSFDAQGPGIEQIIGIPGVHIKGCHLELGGYFLELIEYVTPPGKAMDLSTSNVGSGHFAFVVDDIDQVYQNLKAKGVRFKGAPVQGRPGGPTACYFVDPDGIPLELVQPPK